jgi:tetratricopeptide (TPR) repeat protein
MSKRVGLQIRKARLAAGLTQSQLAGSSYTKAYVSALENGLIHPSVSALGYLAGQLGVTPARLLGDAESTWTRLEADVLLAAGDWERAADAFLALLESAPGPERPGLLRGLAEAYCRLDRPNEAVAAASESAEAFTALGRRTDAGLARYWQAAALHQMENSEEARAILRALIDDVRAGLDLGPDFYVRVLIAASMVESREGRARVALGFLEEARGLTDQLDDRKRAKFLFSLALTYRELGDYEAAITTGLSAVALFRAAEAEFDVASVDNELALVYLALGNVERAAHHAVAAHDRFAVLGDDRWLAHVVDTEAQVELRRGDPDRARQLAFKAAALAASSGDRKALVSSLLSLARAERSHGNVDEAVTALERAAAACRESGRSAQLREVLTELADVHATRGNHEKAYLLTREALTTA